MLPSFFRALFLTISVFSAANCWAGKFDFYAGVFNFAAKTEVTSDSVSNVGAYKISYLVSLLPNLDAGIGYSVLFTNTVSGDAAYGLDLEMAYFPFSRGSALVLKTENSKISVDSDWKPFTLVGYSARQFQSISTQYSGFSLGVGTEYLWNTTYSLKALLKYNFLSGPNNATANESTLLGGVSFRF